MQTVHRAAQTVRFVGSTYRTLRAMKARAVSPEVAGGRLAADAADMGPLYVKMAQFISARRDALDPEFVDALAVVQDRLPCGADPAPPRLEGYRFEPRPIARASIADVFRGVRLRDRRRVVLKRRRAGVRERVLADLPLLLGVMTAAAALGLPGALNMAEMIRESEPMVLGELDFRLEARAQEEFAEMAGARGGEEGGATSPASSPVRVPWLVVPRVLESGEDWMVSEYVPSRRLDEVAPPNAPLAGRLMDLYMTMLDLGFVHADPHPGNLGVLPGGRVVLYDFGAVLRVDPGTKARVAGLLQAGLTRDAEGVVAALEGMGVLRVRPGQRATVRRVVRRLLAPGADVHGELQRTPEFADPGRRVVAFGRTFVYLTRTLTLIEGSCRALDPGFEYDYARWADAPGLAPGLGELARDAASIPATMRTMATDMEEFQARVVEEIDGGKRAGSAIAAAGALAVVVLHFFLP